MKQLFIPILIISCCAEGRAQSSSLFTSLSPEETNIKFINQLDEGENLNYFLEDDLYNGSGLAVGDINNDGLDDIYFVSNFGEDQLYLNKGNFQFENITKTAFEGDYTKVWKTGACMADINADGLLDIYVCRRGIRTQFEEERRNLVFINLGNNTFEELGAEVGLDDVGRSSDIAFFDFDQDGDLDAYVVNRRQNTSVMAQFLRNHEEESMHTNRLYLNDQGTFRDITSKELGIVSFGFCFDASISDINGDGWPDIYVTNDYDVPDFLFINNRQGGFDNQINLRLKHTSHYSMGSDIADFNNDGNQDIFVLDMSNKDYKKSKTNMGSMSVAEFWDRIKRGYPYQYMYNTLQLNLGQGYFSDIAHLSGIASTDWSWAPLLADFDQDGLKDLFVTNGYLREVRDQDFTAKLKDYIGTQPLSFDVEMMLAKIPQTKEVNYFFKNNGDLTFTDSGEEWGMNFGSVSHGSAYSDLDNDGDLDLIVNNLNEAPLVLRNNSSGKNFIRIQLKGNSKNPMAVGAKVSIKSSLGEQCQELYPSRGYSSSSSYTLCFGLEKDELITELKVQWNSKEHSTFKNIKVNQTMRIDYKKEVVQKSREVANFDREENIFVDVTERSFDDFDREILLPHKMSQLGPFLSSGDANGDNKPDMYVGGGSGSPGRLLLGIEEGMLLKPTSVFAEDKFYEDGRSLFFDADMDGDQDLYVVSGGSEFPVGDPRYQDRLYINDANKGFHRDTTSLPNIRASGECVVANDFDLDGDTDLFIGGRQVPGEYPKKPQSYWLVNEDGKFTDKIESIAPDLQNCGMITDVVFTDMNGDGLEDMIVVGEWMTVNILINKKGFFEISDELIDARGLYGWWNCIKAVDIDKDGVQEFLLGNLGLNNKFHPNLVHGLRVYLEDFDKNGKLDIILSKFFGGVEHPVRGKECLTDQIPNLSAEYKTYVDFASAEFGEIFQSTKEHLAVNNFASGMLKKKNGVYEFIPFSSMGQIGPINDIIPASINGDEHLDFVAIGNRYESEIETPRYDSNPGLAFIGNGNGEFDIVPLEIGGNFANKNAKDAILIDGVIYVSNSLESINRIELFFH